MDHPVIVVGAGWAGLSAALQLSRQGKSVVVLEAGNIPGGRARGVCFDNFEMLDNGQHLLLGGYQQVLAQLKALNIAESQVFRREAFNILIHRNFKTNNPSITHALTSHILHFKKIAGFPTHLGLFLGTLFAKGLSIKEKWALAYFFQRLNRSNMTDVAHLSIRDLLHYFKQPASLIQHLWEPLALAALSTPVDRASASIFLSVLQKTFTLSRQYSDLLFPKVDLSSLFPNPACVYLKQKGHSVLFRERVHTLLFAHNRCVGVKTNTGEWAASAVILTVPPFAAAKLLPSNTAFATLQTRLTAFEYHPITTIYLQFKAGTLPLFKSRLMAFTEGVAQWMFDLSNIKQSNNQTPLLSVVITGQGSHSEWTSLELVKKVLTEIRIHYPTLPEPIQTKVITEKRAAFCCNPGILVQRPSAFSTIPGLYLAGDYVNSEFPATLEGAVQSGITAAELLLLR